MVTRDVIRIRKVRYSIFNSLWYGRGVELLYLSYQSHIKSQNSLFLGLIKLSEFTLRVKLLNIIVYKNLDF